MRIRLLGLVAGFCIAAWFVITAMHKDPDLAKGGPSPDAHGDVRSQRRVGPIVGPVAAPDREEVPKAEWFARVRTPDGRPAAMAIVVLSASRIENDDALATLGSEPLPLGHRGVGITATDGTIALGAAEPGHWCHARVGLLSGGTRLEGQPGTIVLNLEPTPRVEVLVLDPRREPVAGADVWLTRGDGAAATGVSGADGRCVMRDGASKADITGLRARAAVPGSRSAPIDLSDPAVQASGRVVVPIGPVGYLQLTILGVEGPVSVVAAEVSDLPTAVAITRSVQNATLLPVASGALRYRVEAWHAGRQVVAARVPGPAEAGDRVPVTLDFSKLTVRGTCRPAQGAGGGAFLAFALLQAEIARFEVASADDGQFSIAMPLADVGAPVLLVRGATYAAIDTRVPAHNGVLNVGDLTMAPRPRLGVLRVVDHQGNVSFQRPSERAFLLTNGVTVPAGLRTGGIVGYAESAGVGLDVFGLPGLEAAVLAPRSAGLFADPEAAVVRGGQTTEVSLRLGGSATLRCPPRAGGVVGLALKRVADDQLVRPDSAAIVDGSQVTTFANLAPGDYAVVTDAGGPTGQSLHVASGSKQDVVVTIE